MNTRITISLRSAAFLDRHGRMLVLCGLSLLLHLLAIVWIDASVAPPPQPGAADLAVRLARPASAVPAPVPVPAPAPVAAPVAGPAPALAATPAPAAAAPVATPVAQPALPPAMSTQGAAPVQMPSRYRVAVPPSVSLRYALRGGADDGAEAALSWETDGVQYRLRLEGILGEIDSEGGTDDAGIAPSRARYSLGAGSAAIAFDRARRRIVLESAGRSVQDRPGSQDGATVLMQLAGIGLADPDQIQDAVDIYVGRADGASVEHYQVAGREQLASPLGPIETLRLVRAARVGEPRLELWLAPGQGWLPVQMRATAPDGSVRTQLLKEIRPQAAGAAAR